MTFLSQLRKSVCPFTRATVLFTFCVLVTVLMLFTVPAAAQLATITTPVLQFNPAPVGTTSATAQTITTTFTIGGWADSNKYSVTLSLHGGGADYNYGLPALNCTPTDATTISCTAAFIFTPTLPGGRKDAVIITTPGNQRSGTIYLAGTGQSSYALVQPGNILTAGFGNSPGYYLYREAIDLNGTIYAMTSNTTDGIYEYSAAGGAPTQIAIAGSHSISGVAIDGGGILYYTSGGYGALVESYDTFTGTSSTVSMLPPPSVYTPCSYSGGFWWFSDVAVDDAGDIFTTEILCEEVIERKADGTFAAWAVNPKMTQLNTLAVDTTGSIIFPGGYDINEIVIGGAQTQVNTTGANEGLAVDAAESIYATRYAIVGHSGGVEMLPASTGYASPTDGFDIDAAPLGIGYASDGTIFISNYTALDKVDRSRGLINFGNIAPNIKSTVYYAGIYNGGNQTMTLTSVTAGADFTLGSATNTCTNGMTIASGAECQVSVSITPTHPGNYAETLDFVSNSLNTTTTTTVALQAQVTGAYLTAVPTLLNFGSVTTGGSGLTLALDITNNGFSDSAIINSVSFPSPVFTFTSSICGTIAAGSSCPMSVNFDPTAAQTYSGNLVIKYTSSTSGYTGTLTVPLSGIGVSPTVELTFSPTSVNFGNIKVGTTSTTQVITVTNPGSTAVSIIGSPTFTGASKAGQFIIQSGSNVCGTVQPGATCYFYVAGTPTVTGTNTASLSVTDNSVHGGFTIPLSVTGVVSNVTLSPSPTLSFGNVALNTPTVLPVTVTNSGPVVANISTIAVTGVGFQQVSGSNPCGATLAAGASCTVNVQFDATTSGAFTGSLTVTDDSPGSPQSITLTGTGAVSNVTLSPSPTLSFGNVPLNTPTVLPVTMTNSGGMPANISAIAVTGAGFQKVSGSNPCGETLAAGASCTVKVQFDATAAGAFTGSLTVTDNSPSSPQSITLTGNGVIPTLSFTPSPLNFGSVAINTTATLPITVTNNSIVLSNISAFSVTGTNFTAASGSTSGCGATLAVGASCVINIQFSPMAVVSYTATFTMTDDATGSPQTVPLFGNGMNPADFLVSTSPSSFTTVAGTPLTIPVSVTSSNGSYTNSVTLTVTGLPAGATGVFAPTSVVPGASGGSSTLTINTAPIIAMQHEQRTIASAGNSSLWLLPLIGFLSLLPLQRATRRARRMMVALILLVTLGALVGLSGCGGGFFLRPPARTYTLTITGTNGSDTHNATVELTVE